MGSRARAGRLAVLVVLNIGALLSLPHVAARAGAGTPPPTSSDSLRRPGSAAGPLSSSSSTTTALPTTTVAAVSPTTTVVAPSTTVTTAVAAPATPPSAPMMTAPPPTLPPGAVGTGRPATVGAAALAAIHYPWHDTGFTISFEPGRTGFYGLTDGDAHVMHIYVRDGETVGYVTRILAHELGHAVDFAFNDDAARARYLSVRGISARDWWACDQCTDFATPAGDWAETFAYWLVHQADYKSRLAPAPSAAELSALSPFFTH